MMRQSALAVAIWLAIPTLSNFPGLRRSSEVLLSPQPIGDIRRIKSNGLADTKSRQ
jgi:hypothetical protein